MNKLLTKSIYVAIAVILVALCVGSAFCLYNVNATQKVVNISAAMPAVDAQYVLGTWNSWTTDEGTNRMAYAAGTYTLNDVSVAAGAGFKIYNGTADTWDATIASCTPPHSGGGLSNITLTNAGTYDISYVEGTGVTITADSMLYTFKCPTYTTNDSACVWAWVYGGSSDGDTWLACTYVGYVDGYPHYTMPMNTDHTTCILVRFPDGTTTPNWDNKYNQSGNFSLANGVVDTTSVW